MRKKNVSLSWHIHFLQIYINVFSVFLIKLQLQELQLSNFTHYDSFSLHRGNHYSASETLFYCLPLLSGELCQVWSHKCNFSQHGVGGHTFILKPGITVFCCCFCIHSGAVEINCEHETRKRLKISACYNQKNEKCVYKEP